LQAHTVHCDMAFDCTALLHNHFPGQAYRGVGLRMQGLLSIWFLTIFS